MGQFSHLYIKLTLTIFGNELLLHAIMISMQLKLTTNLAYKFVPSLSSSFAKFARPFGDVLETEAPVAETDERVGRDMDDNLVG